MQADMPGPFGICTGMSVLVDPNRLKAIALPANCFLHLPPAQITNDGKLCTAVVRLLFLRHFSGESQGQPYLSLNSFNLLLT